MVTTSLAAMATGAWIPVNSSLGGNLQAALGSISNAHTHNQQAQAFQQLSPYLNDYASTSATSYTLSAASYYPQMIAQQNVRQEIQAGVEKKKKQVLSFLDELRSEIKEWLNPKERFA